MGELVSLATAAGLATKARARGERVVLTNGAFDLLHVGHLRYLMAAKREGDLLIVAINTDSSVRLSKGKDRPVVQERERAELVAALDGVDLVVLFDEPTVARVIDALRPDVHAKGTDYSEASVPEGEQVRAYGGRVAIVGDAKAHSTSALVAALAREKGAAPGGSTRGVPLVVSAPSGCGKTTLCRRVMQELGGVAFSVSHTTRAPRPKERDGVDYHFVDEQEFVRLRGEGAFLEWASVHGNSYGTARAGVLEELERGVDVLFDIDLQGGRQIASEIKGTVLVFVAPPSLAALEQRLRARGSDSEETIARRLTNARREIEDAGFYDYWIVNDELELAVRDLAAVLLGERLRRIDKAALAEKLLER